MRNSCLLQLETRLMRKPWRCKLRDRNDGLKGRWCFASGDLWWNLWCACQHARCLSNSTHGHTTPSHGLGGRLHRFMLKSYLHLASGMCALRIANQISYGSFDHSHITWIIKAILKEFGDNCLWVYHHERCLSHWGLIRAAFGWKQVWCVMKMNTDHKRCVFNSKSRNIKDTTP